MKSILILEDNDERIAAFQRAVETLGAEFELRIWRDVPSMRSECEQHFATAALISLDHDLNPAPGALDDPGCGVDAARFLGDFMPVCPVVIHSSNTDRVYSMDNELRFAGWKTDRVGPLGPGWVETSWLKRVRQILAESSNTWKTKLPADHGARVKRMLLSLDGLAIGDALGEALSYRAESAVERVCRNDLPAGPWFHTDDTEMAISIAATLKSHGYIDQDALARRFSRRFEREPDRGYGKMTRIQMREIIAGANWRHTAANAFGGQGSMGNGGAMRVAPLGAYFADDADRCVHEAQASSTVTHTHREGVAGTIAVAVAAATAWRLRSAPVSERARSFFNSVLALTPESKVRQGIVLANQLAPGPHNQSAAKVLGNGSLVTAPDTVPFCIWVVAHYSDNYVEALAQTIAVGGDCDTNAAIVGGIVALSAGGESIPADWFHAKEAITI
jgi:ADP-ribosylglycohydrolase